MALSRDCSCALKVRLLKIELPEFKVSLRKLRIAVESVQKGALGLLWASTGLLCRAELDPVESLDLRASKGNGLLKAPNGLARLAERLKDQAEIEVQVGRLWVQLKATLQKGAGFGNTVFLPTDFPDSRIGFG